MDNLEIFMYYVNIISLINHTTPFESKFLKFSINYTKNKLIDLIILAVLVYVLFTFLAFKFYQI